MKRIKSIALISAVILTLMPVTVFAQKKDNTTSDYNLQKAYEVLRNDKDTDQALELLDKQLMDTPDNTNARLLRARIYLNKEKFGNAISDLNLALKTNKPKKSEIPNSHLHWWMATVYVRMGHFAKAAESYKTAIELARKDNKEYVQNILFSYAQLLYEQKKYEEADAIYRQILREDETNQKAMVGLARNIYERGQYQEMLPLLEDCRKYDADYSEIYHFQAKAYDKIGETDKAIDACVNWFEKDDDADIEFITEIALKHKSYAVAKIQEKANKNESQIPWRVLLIQIYENSSEYELAIKEYDIVESEFGKESYINISRSRNYSNLGLTERALADIEKAFGKDEDYLAYCTKGDILRSAGMYKEAISAFSEAIKLEPMKAWGYYARGWSHELSGDDDKAMEDYNAGIDLDKTYAYIYLMRGSLHHKRGEIEAANADFEKVLQLDTLANDESCAMYAMHFLGRDEDAEAWMQKILDQHPLYAGNYYSKACLYARMGKLDESVAALEMALKKGYCSFEHFLHDDDLDPIRDREDYKALIAEYSAKLEARIAARYKTTGEPRESILTEVAITRHPGGTFEIPCEINGLSLNMLFDTGASDVTISSVEANFMLKNGHLGKDDIKGKTYYQIADGNLTEGTVITLKEIKVGDAILKNVDASVVKSQRAPLLLGQSVMERFGTITIDNINGKLIIKQ